MSRTDLAVAFIRDAASSDLTEQAIISEIVRIINLEYADPGQVDSHRVASALHRRRMVSGRVSSPDQCRDYVQHLFREAKHVCRHADGHHYTVHADETCSGTCDARYELTRPQRSRPVSQCCFVEVTTQGLCPFGCDS